MVFEIKEKQDKCLEEVYEKSMKELDEFFELGWEYCRPQIILVPDRKTIDKLKDQKTDGWYIAWVDGERTIYLLNPKNYEKESTHKFSKEEYSSVLKHELAHCFSKVLAKDKFRPYWLNEGIAIYLSGQNRLKKKPEKLSSFLDYFDKYDHSIYKESGFAVESLVKNHGKEKLLTLLKKLNQTYSKETFEELFESIYGFKLDYQNFPVL